ncbi:MAG TPA: transglutaminase family protein [Candidatus Acidoferrales bacterium]|nr:transglutaminase family protein [Candidatus Acidoferrales bacterium]
MRFSIVHTTRYRYDAPVHLEPHTFRLCPRQDGAQRVLSYQLEISPKPAGRAEALDENGNVITQAWFAGITDVLDVRSAFEVETLRENPFDFLLAQRDRWLPGASGAQVPESVAAFARSLAEQSKNQTIPFLTALTQAIFQNVRQVVRRHGAPHLPEKTLLEREGSCRDLAVLFCDACRAAGVNARFVSGYERDASLQENGEMHAWAEVYLHGGGWRGYDPSRGLAVASSHVAVAAAADPAEAAPLSGAYRGSAHASMDFQIAIQVA